MKTSFLLCPLAVLLLFPASAPAQTEAIPIAGRVLDAADGTPIAGAIVHYRGAGNVSDGHGHLAAPPTLQGEVATAPDGSYSTPPLPAFGDFTLRASAPGFFAARDYLQALPENLRHPTPPIPPGYRGPAPAPHDGTLRLRPDLIALHPMPDAALAAFALPLTVLANRSYLDGSFSPGSRRLAFITLDSLAEIGKSITRHCRIWDYDLATGQLHNADLVDSPNTADIQRPDLPPGFCSAHNLVSTPTGLYPAGYSILWNGDSLYLLYLKSNPRAPTAPPASAVFVLNGDRIALAPPATLPPSVQSQVAARTAPRRLSSSVIPANTTADGRFSVSQNFDDSGRGSCAKLVAIAAPAKASRTIAPGCPGFTSLLDAARDLVFYTQPATPGSPDRFETIAEFNLLTGARRTFSVPAINYQPELLAQTPLPGGASRIAYTIHGDCDFAASDYSQPGQPDGVLGNTPNQFSVCFATIPPPRQTP